MPEQPAELPQVAQTDQSSEPVAQHSDSDAAIGSWAETQAPGASQSPMPPEVDKALGEAWKAAGQERPRGAKELAPEEVKTESSVAKVLRVAGRIASLFSRSRGTGRHLH